MNPFLFVTFVSVACAAPMYRNELRHLPEKLKQERILETVQNTFLLIQRQIIQAAMKNTTSTNFTLFCLEPNFMQNGARTLFRKQGSTYALLEQEEYDYQYNPNLKSTVKLIPLDVKPRCSVKVGYTLYSRHYHWETADSYPLDHPFYVPIDFTARGKAPGITYPNLEEDPHLYIQHFFQTLNQQFPDLSLDISHERKTDSKTEGIFENDCCPIYTVSW